VVLLAGLLADSKVALHILWDVVVPVAPLLVVLAPGLWRNICPLASSALAADKFENGGAWKPSRKTQGWLSLVGVAGLFLLVPMRHIVFNTSGPATAMILIVLVVAAALAGTVFAAKSGWCSGMCPVHPVERLYGSESLLRLRNAHCVECVRCVAPCPDSVPGIDPFSRIGRQWSRRIAGTMMLGGFPGFVVTWFFVPDYRGVEGWAHLDVVYGLPLIGTVISLALFALTRSVLSRRWHLLHARSFAAAAVCAYYWFRLPALVGFSVFPGDGMLVDLTATLPGWTPWAMRAVTTAGLLWLLVGRRSSIRAWSLRPPVSRTLRGAAPRP